MSAIAILLFFAEVSTGDRANCKSPTVQIEMNFCAGQRYDRADQEMNRQWKLTLAAMREEDRLNPPRLSTETRYADLLLKSQRAWLAFRDAQCASEAEVRGTMRNAVWAECMTNVTDVRTSQLRQMRGAK